MDKLIAVLIDDDRKRNTKLEEIWKGILTDVYSEIDFTVIEDINKVEQIFKHRPHILIVDNVFCDKDGREESNVGVDFIKTNKSKYSDILFILCTGATFQVDALGNRFPNPDFIVTKTHLTFQPYQTYITSKIKELLKRMPCGEVAFSEDLSHFDLKEKRDHIASILEQCTAVFHSSFKRDNQFRIVLTPLGGGYSGSNVFQCDITGREMHSTVPFVFKFGKNLNIFREVDNYNSNVRLNMPHDMRVDLVGYGNTDEFGGVLYAFAFGKEAGIISATDALNVTNSVLIDTIINKVLLSETIGWYKNPLAGAPIPDFYSNSEEYSPSKDVNRLHGLEKNISKITPYVKHRINEEIFEISCYKVEHIRRLLNGFYDETVVTALCHGDFNTNNIFLDSSGTSIATIDFEYSCQDMLFKDFISLESSARVYCNDVDCELEPLIRQEIYLLKHTTLPENSTKYINNVFKIRNSANLLHSKIDIGGNIDYTKMYNVGLAMHLFKLLGLEIWKESQIKRLTAGFFAVLSHLSN